MEIAGYFNCMKIIFLSHCCFQSWLLNNSPEFNLIHHGQNFLMPDFDRSLAVKRSIGTAPEIVTMGLFLVSIVHFFFYKEKKGLELPSR